MIRMISKYNSSLEDAATSTNLRAHLGVSLAVRYAGHSTRESKLPRHFSKSATLLTRTISMSMIANDRIPSA